MVGTHCPSRISAAAAWTLVVACAVAIFVLSAAPADESQVQSTRLAQMLVTWLHPEYCSLAPGEQTMLLETADHIVRKAAHATEYAAFGALSLIAFRNTFSLLGGIVASPPASRRAANAALILSALYAVSDEIHQLFVPGRAGMFSDVLIDSAGALVGILLILALLAAINHTRVKGA